MKVETLQDSFAGGEFGNDLMGRNDIDQYKNACATMENLIVKPSGAAISSPGTEYISSCKTGGSTSLVRVFPFIFSRTDSYIIEAGVGYFRFYTNGGQVET